MTEDKRDTTYKKVEVLDNDIQANILESVLQDRSIPHIMRSYHDCAYNGIFQISKGWGSVSAPEEYHDEIRSILKDLEEGSSLPEDPSDETPDQ